MKRGEQSKWETGRGKERKNDEKSSPGFRASEAESFVFQGTIFSSPVPNDPLDVVLCPLKTVDKGKGLKFNLGEENIKEQG